MIYMAEKNIVKSEITVKELPMLAAESAPLGLIGLAVATLVLASTDLGLTSHTAKSLMIPWVLFFGATAQLIAGTMEFKRNNIFGADSVYNIFYDHVCNRTYIIYYHIYRC